MLESIKMFDFILIANAIWFGMAFNVFALRNAIFAKILVPREHRDTPVFDVLAETGKFLGGFNLAFCVLNVLILINSNIFPEGEQRIILCSVFALAHGSQFIANVPIALDNLRGKGVWQVKGTMRFIFITDFIMMVANLGIVLLYAC
tara:strand:- start:6421 stop:6861 length:441 start_codon:yes stop_codon:yes gene_type:complete